MNKRIPKGRILNVLFFIAILVILFVPSAKAMLLQGLMKIGLFKPNIETPAATNALSAAETVDLRFKDAKGKTVTLSELKGKVVFLNFWATWCPPCLAEMPSISKLYQKYKDDEQVVFILVDADSKLPKAQAYMDKKKFAMPLYTLESNVPEAIFSGSLPTTVVFDKQGRVSYNEAGAANYASKEFVGFIEKLKL